jgi:hypothetical protein
MIAWIVFLHHGPDWQRTSYNDLPDFVKGADTDKRVGHARANVIGMY